jgi:hypothetical protein
MSKSTVIRKFKKRYIVAVLAVGCAVGVAQKAEANDGLARAIQDMTTANQALITAAGLFSNLSVSINGIRAGQEMFKKLILGGI